MQFHSRQMLMDRTFASLKVHNLKVRMEGITDIVEDKFHGNTVGDNSMLSYEMDGVYRRSEKR